MIVARQRPTGGAATVPREAANEVDERWRAEARWAFLFVLLMNCLFLPLRASERVFR
jgi:hypothetical protein